MSCLRDTLQCRAGEIGTGGVRRLDTRGSACGVRSAEGHLSVVPVRLHELLVTVRRRVRLPFPFVWTPQMALPAPPTDATDGPLLICD
eukprot:7386033-Prymnesium_polylepis.1